MRSQDTLGFFSSQGTLVSLVIFNKAGEHFFGVFDPASQRATEMPDGILPFGGDPIGRPAPHVQNSLSHLVSIQSLGNQAASPFHEHHDHVNTSMTLFSSIEHEVMISFKGILSSTTNGFPFLKRFDGQSCHDPCFDLLFLNKASQTSQEGDQGALALVAMDITS